MARQNVVAFRQTTTVSTRSGHSQTFEGGHGVPVRRRDVLQEALARGGMLVEKPGLVQSMIPDTVGFDDEGDGSDYDDDTDREDEGSQEDHPITKLQHLARTVRAMVDEDNPDLLTDDGKVKVSLLAERAKEHVTAEERDQAHGLLDKGEA